MTSEPKSKKFLIVLISTFLSILFFYLLFFIKIHFERHDNAPHLFKSIDTLKFHQKYSSKLHHLRDSDGRWEIENQPENYLFSTINNFSNNTDNILIQGDSWAERMYFVENSFNLFNNFARKNNFGLINAGITSYSPSLMQLQYEILEKDFNIKPNIVVAYIDQTDIGDELCRYKDKRVFNEKDILVNVKNENYSRAAYDYTKIYNISEITLLTKSKLTRSFKLANFFIKYGSLRLIEKFKSIDKYGWKNRDISKCRFSDIKKYLVSSNNKDISYFENRIKDYINLLINKEYIQKIILVTFPHRNHIPKYSNLNDKYSINVSSIVEKVIKNKRKISHLNFSKLIFDEKIYFESDPFLKNDPGSHLNEEYQANIFGREIINLLK